MGRLVDLEIISVFQHTAARRRLDLAQAKHTGQALFQHTAARRRLGILLLLKLCPMTFQHTAARRRLAFGGGKQYPRITCFNTQPPEGGWAPLPPPRGRPLSVSTHSRPKAAGRHKAIISTAAMSFNTQPPEGGWFAHRIPAARDCQVSTHSRPKAAGRKDGD